MNTVTITADNNGNLFTKALKADGTPKLDKNGDEHGFIRVKNADTIDLAFAYQDGGVKRGNSALVAMKCKAWERAKNAYKAGMEVKGRVIVVESLTKEHNGYQEKKAGSELNAPTCKVDGKIIYRATEFDPTGLKDNQLIAHNNQEEIKAFQASQKALGKAVIVSEKEVVAQA